MTDTGETTGLREGWRHPKYAFVQQRVCNWRLVLEYEGEDDCRSAEKVFADAILALPQLAAQQARIVELEAALEPFGWMAEQIDHSRVSLRVTPPVQADDDKQEVLVAGNEDGFSTLTRGHFRRARAALRKDPQQ